MKLKLTPPDDAQTRYAAAWARHTKPGKELVEKAAQLEQRLSAGFGPSATAAQVAKLGWVDIPEVKELQLQIERLAQLTNGKLTEELISEIAGPRTLTILKAAKLGTGVPVSGSILQSYVAASTALTALEVEAHKKTDYPRTEAKLAAARAATPGYAEAAKAVARFDRALASLLYSPAEVQEQKLGLLDRPADSLYAQAMQIEATIAGIATLLYGHGPQLTAQVMPPKREDLETSSSGPLHLPPTIAVLVDQVAFLRRVHVAMQAQHRTDPLTKELGERVGRLSVAIQYAANGHDYPSIHFPVLHIGPALDRLVEQGLYPAELAKVVREEELRNPGNDVTVEHRVPRGMKAI